MLYEVITANLTAQTVRLVGQAKTEAEALRTERDSLRRKVRHQYGFDNMVGQTAVMRQIFDSIRQVAKWDTTVLVRGESGTRADAPGDSLVRLRQVAFVARELEPVVEALCERNNFV